ncbi:MAG: carboxypeptidase-like regulatory domain-containing protein, partial [Bacteroidales bacterium]|nr:carboxypeptidase-like regulatory domain-containing protein [Bacteroidales bacterium]
MTPSTIKKIFLSILFFSTIWISTNAQHLDSVQVSFKKPKYESVNVLLKELESQYPFSFYYKSEWFSNDSIQINTTPTTLSKVLDKIIGDKAFLYEIVQNHLIVFLPKEQVSFLKGDLLQSSDEIKGTSVQTIGNPSEAGKYDKVTVSGVVKNGKTGEPMIGTTIKIKNTNQGVTTDLEGQYTLNIEPGIYTLEISSVG